MKPLQLTSRSIGVVCVVCALLVSSGSLFAQSNVEETDFEQTLKKFAGNEAAGYMQPLGDLFGANINSGIFHSGDVPTSGFHFKFEIVGMGGLVGDAQKVYTANAPPGFNPGTFQTASVFGGKRDSVTDTGSGAKYYGVADGMINTSMLPLAAPQITIGDIYGTRAIVRFITTPEISGFPKVTLWGLGVQHSVSQYLPDFPIDIASHFFYNKFTVGDLIDVTGISIGAMASKSFSVLTIYGGPAWEKSTLDLSYTPSNGSSPVNLSLSGANNFRFTIGLGLQLGPLSLFGDANFGSVTALSAGIGFGG